MDIFAPDMSGSAAGSSVNSYCIVCAAIAANHYHYTLTVTLTKKV